MVFLKQRGISDLPRWVSVKLLRRWWWMAVVAIGVLLPLHSYPLPPTAEEYTIKAAYLYNFTKFVEWPPVVFTSDSSVFSVCILGHDPFGNALDIMEDKAVRNRPVVVWHLPSRDSLAGCQLVFISESESQHLQFILSKLANNPVLTVSDIQGFSKAGGMIGLINIGQTVRFEINLSAVRSANLKISSQLLKLAKIVGDSE